MIVIYFPCLFRSDFKRYIVAVYSFRVSGTILILSYAYFFPALHFLGLSSVCSPPGSALQVAVMLFVRCHLCTGSSTTLLFCVFASPCSVLISFFLMCWSRQRLLYLLSLRTHLRILGFSLISLFPCTPCSFSIRAAILSTSAYHSGVSSLM